MLHVYCSKGIQRFEGIIQNLNGVLMFEEYHMRVLADVQQARKLMAPFLQAKTLSDLFDKVSPCALTVMNSLQPDFLWSHVLVTA